MIMGSVGFQPFQLEEVRARLRKMTDADLLRFGRAAASLCRPEEQFGHPPRQVFVVQLYEARAEWRPASQARRYRRAVERGASGMIMSHYRPYGQVQLFVRLCEHGEAESHKKGEEETIAGSESGCGSTRSKDCRPFLVQRLFDSVQQDPQAT
jgi:hypothetical protein